MPYARLVLAAVAAFVVYLVLGFAFFAAGPLRDEFAKYPAVYRSAETMKSVMPFGMAAMFVAMLVLAGLFAATHPTAPAALAGARFGAAIGLFAVCAFVVHNHVNLNVGARLTLGQAIAYFVEWTAVGVTLGLVLGPRKG
jgi:hypothetical protein